jgi:phage terminase small subunit
VPDTEQPTPKRGLTPKQKRFVEAYLETWNAVEAARRAQYGCPLKAGWRVLHVPAVEAEIKRRLQENIMAADEVMSRLTEQGRLNAAMFFYFVDVPVLENGKPVLDENGKGVTRREMVGINWGMVERYGHLIKKIGYDRKGRPVLEFHDAQHALELIGKRHKLFTDSVDLNVNGSVKAYVGISPDDWD